ncbi:autoinducer 2-binding protein LsrB precursor [Peptococcaceae bacterium CEB3]|nr:autoinducer 2-binding protein LsrB precursor [Peptococcaceae bacterium CEB3]
MKTIGWKRMATALVILLLIVALAGCGAVQSSPSANSNQNAAQTSQKGKTIKVALIPKAIGIPYFTGAEQGAQSVAAALNIKLTYNGPTTLSASDQVSMINSYVAEGYNVIAVSANDPTSLAPALKAAMKKGVKVITWDSDTVPDARQFFVNQATVDGIGSTLVKVVADHFKGKQTDVAILSSTPSNTNQNQWIDAMKKTIADKYPNLHIKTIQYDQGQPSTGVSATENIVKGFPTVKAIISPDSVGLPAAAEAVEKLGLQGKIYVTGLADPVVMKKYVDDGTVQKYVLWNVLDLGKLTMNVARAVADGTMPTSGTFKVKGLGDFQVNNGQVLLGLPMIFDKAATDKYNF